MCRLCRDDRFKLIDLALMFQLRLMEVPDDGSIRLVRCFELALRLGASVEQVHEASGIDPWFLAEIAGIGALGAQDMRAFVATVSDVLDEMGVGLKSAA